MMTDRVGSMFDLSGKIAVVTGARRGIGAAIAGVLADAGADIVAVSAQLEPGSGIEKRVRMAGREFYGHRVDFRDRVAVSRFAAEVLDRHGEVDILVNNAGTIRRAPAVDHGDELWDEVVEVDLRAPFVLTRTIGAAMVRRGRGKVVFTASLLSYQGGITVPGYAAAKSGVAGLTRAFANEWASHGVNVNALVPGYIATDNTQALQDDPGRSAAILGRIPAGRWGTAEDLAGAALFLCAPASDYVHGALLPVDGGWLAR